MVDEARLCSPVRLTREVLVVWCVVGHMCCALSWRRNGPILLTSTCRGPALAGSRGYPQDERHRQEREGQVCVLLFDNRFYTLSQNVFKVQDAYTGLVLHHFVFLGKAGCFLLSNSIVTLGTWSSGLGAIHILCRSGECKPIFHFYGDLNWKVTVS